MPTRKAILISNPKSGGYGSHRRIPLEKVLDHLTSRGLEVELIPTSYAGEAANIAQRAIQIGIQDVIASGGDGTINEVLQGIIGSSARLGIIPRGTANVLARELDLPLDNLKAAEVIAVGKTQRVHVGKAIEELGGQRERHFFLMAGIGLDASVIRRVRPSLKKHFGEAAFWFSGLSHLINWKPTPFTIEVNDQVLLATFAAIGKSASYGGKLAVTPRARLAEPMFEVCVISLRNRLRYLQLLPRVMRSGVPHGNRSVKYLRTAHVRASGTAPIQIDGELFGTLPMIFEIALETVEVIVP